MLFAIFIIIKEIIKKNIFIARKNELIKEGKRSNNNSKLINQKIIKMVLIIIQINKISSKININKNFIFNSSEIIIKINETGMHSILNNEYIDIKYPCPSLVYLNLEIQNLTNCSKINITKPGSIIKLIWNNPLNSLHCLFCNCSNITEIKFLNFDTSLITDISNLFENCYSLISVDISNLNINNVNLTRNMFYNCINLTSFNLSKVDLSKIINMDKLFYNCKNLKYINLLNFTNKESPSKKDIFYGIITNTEINIDKNKASSIYNLANNIPNFITLRKLEQISNNIIESNIEEESNLIDLTYIQNSNNKDGDKIIVLNSIIKPRDDNIFDSEKELFDSIKINDDCYISCATCNGKGNYINHNCTSCSYNYSYYLNLDGSINCYDKCYYYFYKNLSDNNYYCTSDFSCPNNFNKLIPNKTQCIDKCSKDSIYSYEFNHTCYEECPDNTNKTNDFYCKLICSREYPYEIVMTQICVKNCTIAQRGNSACIINYKLEDENNKEVEDKEVENIKEELTSGFNTSDIDNGKNIIINQKDSTVTISTTENQKNSNSTNLTTINLGDCEDKLKTKYNIPKRDSLYILKIDVNQKGIKIPKIAYEVYYSFNDNNLVKLDLSVCQDSKIEILIPVNISGDLDIVNPDSGYYNDICYTYTSEDGTDISLKDRRNNFKDDLIVCEEDCKLNGYTDGKANCSCDVKINATTKISDIVFDRSKFFDSFINFKNIVNLDVLKCYKLIFDLNAAKHNYGNLFMITIIIFFFITLFIFYFKDYFYLKLILNLIVFFKLNTNIVKKFLVRKKEEDLINKKKMRNSKLNKKGIIEDLNLPQPLYKEYLQLSKKFKINNAITKQLDFLCKSMNIKDNLIKRKKRSRKYYNNNLETNNFKSTKRKILDKNNETKEEKLKIYYPYDMDENKVYELFLLIHKKSDSEMNELSYNSAIKFDKRTYLEFYLSLIRTKHLFIYSFLPAFDYNSQIIKIFLFFFNFSFSFFVNALFFNDETMHKIYEDKGSFDFIYNLPQILLSTLISGFINGIIQDLALTDSILISLKERVYIKNIIAKKQKSLKTIKIKILFFFIIALLLLVLFWFYLACFCAVYKNTQIHLIKDTVISFGTSMIIPFGFYALPGIFRIVALKTKKINKKLFFKFSKFLLFLFDRIL